MVETKQEECQDCGGTGEVPDLVFDPDDLDDYEPQYHRCRACNGTGIQYRAHGSSE